MTDPAAELDDHQLAGLLAQNAGEQLQALRQELFASNTSYLQRELLGDQLSHRYLFAALSQFRPDDHVLSEEGHDRAERIAAERVWIIDPLDGSSDYADQWSQTWAIHVGLACEGVPTAGAVAVPEWDATYRTGEVGPPPVAERERPVVVIARSRARWDGHQLVRQLDADVYGVGSAGVKAMTVVTGEADAWVHGGGLYEWDTCAPAAVALAAGLHVSHLDGEPLRYNRADPAQWGIVVCRPELADPILSAFAERHGP